MFDILLSYVNGLRVKWWLAWKVKYVAEDERCAYNILWISLLIQNIRHWSNIYLCLPPRRIFEFSLLVNCNAACYSRWGPCWMTQIIQSLLLESSCKPWSVWRKLYSAISHSLRLSFTVSREPLGSKYEKWSSGGVTEKPKTNFEFGVDWSSRFCRCSHQFLRSYQFPFYSFANPLFRISLFLRCDRHGGSAHSYMAWKSTTIDKRACVGTVAFSKRARLITDKRLWGGQHKKINMKYMPKLTKVKLHLMPIEGAKVDYKDPALSAKAGTNR